MISQCGIYYFKNINTNQYYIGQSVNVHSRINHHLTNAFNSNCSDYNSRLHQALCEYGLVAFEWGLLFECDKSLLNDFEYYLILKFNTVVNGYNSKQGGLAGSHTFHLTEDDVTKIMDLLRNSELSQEKIGDLFGVSRVTVSQINLGFSRFRENISYPIRVQKTYESTTYYCKKCNSIITSRYANMCKSCARIYNHNIQTFCTLSRDELKQLIRFESFSFIGRRFNVSDNTVRKWCKYYKLPFRVRDIKSYSDSEWKEI